MLAEKFSADSLMGMYETGISEKMTGKRIFIGLALIATLALAAYSNIFSVPFQFDGKHALVNNRNIHIRELSAPKLFAACFRMENWADPSMRPVANLTFALNHYFGGLNTFGYHAVDLAIHILSAIAVFFFTHTTLSLLGERARRGPGENWLIALATSLLWLAHPIQTQAVTYIYQRYTSMAGMLCLWSLLSYVEARRAQIAEKKCGRITACYTAAAILFLLALGTKEVAASLPVIVLLYELLIFPKNSRNWTRLLPIQCAIFAVPVVIMGMIYARGLEFDAGGGKPNLSVNLPKAVSHLDLSEGYGDEFSRGQRLLTQPRVLMRYISLLLWPRPSRLNLDHHVIPSKSLLEPPTTVMSLLGIIAILICAVCLARRAPLPAFCALWFFANLAIESTVFMLEMAFEHRLYIPSIGFAIPAASFLIAHCNPRNIPLGKVTLFLTIMLFSLWSYERNQVWRTEESLWLDALHKSPNKARPREMMGNVRLQQGRLDEALSYYRRALDLNPGSSKANYNMGTALWRLGKTPEAIERYSRALRLNPKLAEAHVNLGIALQSRGESDKAAAHCAAALQIRPGFAEACYNLGNILAAQGNITNASAQYAEALRISPDLPEAHNALGVMMARRGLVDDAMKHYAEALRIQPNLHEAHNNIANLLWRQGAFQKAEFHYSRALSIKPDYVDAHINMGVMLMKQGRAEDAIRRFSEALRIAPDNAAARKNLERAKRAQELDGPPSV